MIDVASKTPDLSALSTFSCTDVTGGSALSVAEQERHTIYLLLVMALVFDEWGVNHARREQVEAYAAAAPGRVFPDYLGHNVGAVLVAPDGAILDFGLNRNVSLNSTLEHAEYRVVRRAIDRANAAAGPGNIVPWSFGSLLEDHLVYITLEPCAQCTGITDLARIGRVIYAQADPSLCRIAHALHELRRGPGTLPAPLPIRADFFPFWQSLDDAFRAFLTQVPTDSRRGVSSFLETVEAWRIYGAAAAAFEAFAIEDPTNAPVLDAARTFRARRPSDPVASLLGG